MNLVPLSPAFFYLQFYGISLVFLFWRKSFFTAVLENAKGRQLCNTMPALEKFSE